MGEMADMARAQAYEMAYDGDFDGYDHGGFCSARRNIICWYCGRTGLHWKRHSGGWRLFSDRGLHACLTSKNTNSTQPKRKQPMGLFTRNPLYITDRGDEFQINEMEPSHLLNAINHHRTQVDTVDWILENSKESEDLNNLHRRRINLYNTVEALVKELKSRDPDNDYE